MNLIKKMKNKKGFTLIELIVVIAIIAVLVALLVPNVVSFLSTAKKTQGEANAKTVYTVAQAYATQKITDGTPLAKTDADNTYDGTDIANMLDSSVTNNATISFTVGDDGTVTSASWSSSSNDNAHVYTYPAA
jgi:type IV pilus assembly protein PilA